jgi:pre-mRNA-splicing factor ATP-dependent RNA helicase DHX15/PRP43
MKKRLDLGNNTSAGAPSEPTVNPYNGSSYSERYFSILEKRKTLPVWEQREDFQKVFRENQVLILQGETGSGKTTQVCIQVYNGR